MFDHVQIKVSDLKKSRAFYAAVLGTLGHKVVFEIEDVVVGIGNNPHDMFEISKVGDETPLSKSVHVAFTAKSQEEAQAFYKVALEHGAKDNGAPGFRDYEPGYFAAFVIDPDGHNLEVVFQDKTKQ